MRKCIIYALLVVGVSAAPPVTETYGKFKGFNTLRTYMDFVRRDPAVLRLLRPICRVFQNVMNHETRSEGTEAVLLYGRQVCVDFTKPAYAQRLCDVLKQEKALGKIKEICFEGSDNDAVREILLLHKDSLCALRFQLYDFMNEDILLPTTLQNLFVGFGEHIVKDFWLQLKNLSQLKNFSVLDGNMTGADLPSNLEYLSISYCRNMDPHLQLSGCTRLKKLHVSVTNITCRDLPTTLQELNISWCENLDPHLQLERCTGLRILNAENSSLRRVDLPASLEEMDISYCEHLDPHLQLSVCSQLKMLDATGSNVRCTDLPSNLEYVNISSCKNLDPRLQLKGCVRLKILKASSTDITHLDLPSSLEVLDISSCKNLDPTLNLSHLCKLRELNASRSNLRGIGLPATLEELNITGCKNLNPKFWDQLKTLPQVKKLSVEGASFRENMVLPGVKIIDKEKYT